MAWTRWNWFCWGWGAASTFHLVLTTPPDQIASNAADWLKFFGL